MTIGLWDKAKVSGREGFFEVRNVWGTFIELSDGSVVRNWDVEVIRPFSDQVDNYLASLKGD